MRSLALFSLAALLPAAELPLGTVEQVEEGAVALRFDAAAAVAPGQVLALYAPGKVEKHPLTKETLREGRVLAAKAQVLTIAAGAVRARLVWLAAGAAPAAGWDAVPLPGEAAPNAPPVLAGDLPVITAAPGTSVRLALPVVDPDGDPLSISWTLEGQTGLAGRLEARSTLLPSNAWTAPGLPATAAAVATIRDALGQELVVRLPLKAAGDAARKALQPFAQLGAGHEAAPVRLRRDADGSWLELDAEGRLSRRAAGWLAAAPVELKGEPRKPVAIAVARGELHVLDAGRNLVSVHASDGAQKRLLGLSDGKGLLDSPTDLAVAADGTVFVADQGLGGVAVFEAGGRFRALLGRKGRGDEGFTKLERVCLDPEGTLYALDQAERRIWRWDRALRRLDSWVAPGGIDVPPVDLAWHPRGLLVLLADGKVGLFTAKGQAETWKGVTDAGWHDKAGRAASICVDTGGDWFVSYPESGLVARGGADGRLTGLRGASLRNEGSPERWAADGLGRTAALDGDRGFAWLVDAEGWRTLRLAGTKKNGGACEKPVALAFAPDGGSLAVLDAERKAVLRFGTARPGEAPQVLGQPGRNAGQFSDPLGLALDAAGRVFAIDGDNTPRVSVFDPRGTFAFAFGAKGDKADELSEPLLVAVAPAGDACYVYDADSYEIKKYAIDAQAGAAKHIANLGSKGDGPGQFRKPAAMGVDRAGLLYVLDSSREDLQVIDFRGNSGLPLLARTREQLGAAKIGTMAVSPDGQVWLWAKGVLTGLRW